MGDGVGRYTCKMWKELSVLGAKSHLCLKVVLGRSRAIHAIIMHLLFLGVQLSREICNSFLGSLFPG